MGQYVPVYSSYASALSSFVQTSPSFDQGRVSKGIYGKPWGTLLLSVCPSFLVPEKSSMQATDNDKLLCIGQWSMIVKSSILYFNLWFVETKSSTPGFTSHKIMMKRFRVSSSPSDHGFFIMFCDDVEVLQELYLIVLLHASPLSVITPSLLHAVLTFVVFRKYPHRILFTTTYSSYSSYICCI